MISLSILGYICFVLLSINPNIAFEIKIYNFPNDGDLYLDNYEDGDSVVLKTVEICRLRSESFCYMVQDNMSRVYGQAYTPSLPHHTVDDYRMGRRILISYLVNRFHYKSYLEIGCGGNKTFSVNSLLFSDYAYCVDPAQGGTHRMTSDAYFAKNTLTYDVIFIDGLHDAIQVLKDVENARKVLNEGGIYECI